jgi:hypothetical protein
LQFLLPSRKCLDIVASSSPAQGENEKEGREQWELGPLPGEELYVRGHTVVWSQSGQVR